MKTAEIKSLLTLLSDDDPETAGIAMTGLLALDESELEAVLGAIQEASDPNLRMKSISFRELSGREASGKILQ